MRRPTQALCSRTTSWQGMALAALLVCGLAPAAQAEQSARDLASEFPKLPIRPVVADYTQTLDLPVMENVRKRVGFFPGSTIGNFQPEAAMAFLRRIARIRMFVDFLAQSLITLAREPR